MGQGGTQPSCPVLTPAARTHPHRGSVTLPTPGATSVEPVCSPGAQPSLHSGLCPPRLGCTSLSHRVGVRTHRVCPGSWPPALTLAAGSPARPLPPEPQVGGQAGPFCTDPNLLTLPASALGHFSPPPHGPSGPLRGVKQRVPPKMLSQVSAGQCTSEKKPKKGQHYPVVLCQAEASGPRGRRRETREGPQAKKTHQSVPAGSPCGQGGALPGAGCPRLSISGPLAFWAPRGLRATPWRRGTEGPQ